jgi:pyruvate,water dikinase
MVTGLNQGGVTEVATPDERKGKPCLTPEQAAELASLAVNIEKHFGSPRDIEWAINKGGRVYILQARPLNISVKNQVEAPAERLLPDSKTGYPVLMQNKGAWFRKERAQARSSLYGRRTT